MRSVTMTEVYVKGALRRGMHAARRIAWYIRAILRIRPATESEVVAGLARKCGRAQRYEPGEFLTPLGKIVYGDLLSVRWQYEEIFIDRAYDFKTTNATPLIIDAGGNVGLSVLRFKMLYPDSKITVLEADPQNAELLRENMRELRLAQVEVIEGAAWEHGGFVQFQRDGADSGRVSSERDRRSVRVRSIRLADLMSTQVDMLKLDVEGAEFAILQDLQNESKLHLVQRIVCEVHADSMGQSRLPALLQAIVDAGFSYSVVNSHADEAKLSPTQFPAVRGPDFLAMVYAWRDEAR